MIQQIGLFPHRTIAENIATVPELLGWDKRRVAARVTELMSTVGLPDQVADRYPHQLSGGQRQRVGVARALAADPPIMLMDEPFGAVDPIVRARLQQEFLRLQRQVRKTIVFVTHDIDEAIVMGDRIAILAEGGVLQQYDTPEEILRAPANDFVVEFLGPERGLKRLSLIPVSEVRAEPGPVVHPGDSRGDAERAAADYGSDWVVVVENDGKLRGWLALADMNGVVDRALARPFSTSVDAADTLRAALDALITSHDRRGRAHQPRHALRGSDHPRAPDRGDGRRASRVTAVLARAGARSRTGSSCRTTTTTSSSGWSSTCC